MLTHDGAHTVSEIWALNLGTASDNVINSDQEALKYSLSMCGLVE